MPLDNYIINQIDEVYQFYLFPILYGLVYNVIFKKRIDMNKWIKMKELEETMNISCSTIKMLLRRYPKEKAKKISTRNRGRGRIPYLYNLRILRELYKKHFERECVNCGREFLATTYTQKFCTKECHRYHKGLANKKGNKTKDGKGASSIHSDFGEFADHSYRITKGKSDAKRIRECSVECLLDELGDIE